MGPLTIGVALTRRLDGDGGKAAGSGSGREQRVVITGDGDFLANSYLGNGGNLQLGMNMVNWLTSNDEFINIPTKTAPDVSLSLTQAQASVLAIAFLIVLPAASFGSANPVLFDRVTFPDLMKLEGDVGGRGIFSKHKVTYLPWHDDALLLDVDTPEHYQRLRDLLE